MGCCGGPRRRAALTALSRAPAGAFNLPFAGANTGQLASAAAWSTYENAVRAGQPVKFQKNLYNRYVAAMTAEGGRGPTGSFGSAPASSSPGRIKKLGRARPAPAVPSGGGGGFLGATTGQAVSPDMQSWIRVQATLEPAALLTTYRTSTVDELTPIIQGYLGVLATEQQFGRPVDSLWRKIYTLQTLQAARGAELRAAQPGLTLNQRADIVNGLRSTATTYDRYTPEGSALLRATADQIQAATPFVRRLGKPKPRMAV